MNNFFTVSTVLTYGAVVAKIVLSYVLHIVTENIKTPPKTYRKKEKNNLYCKSCKDG